MAEAVLNQINLVVGDIRASATFYRLLGVEIAEHAGEGTPFHANAELKNDFDFDLDSVRFAQVWNKGWAGNPNLVGKVVVGFSLPSREAVDLTYAEITAAGHRGLAPPYDAFWGARYAIVEDPNGVAVGLMSPIDPERRFWPPENWEA